ncbi:MAG: chemotaxis protein [Planctomycetota bacterium]
MAGPKQHDILLESGTNELEVLVFTLGKQRYGVNVAKVREVIEPLPVTKLPESHAAVSGMFQLRDSVTPLIDLHACLHLQRDPEVSETKIIIMEFNDARVAFAVNAVEQIYRVNWKEVSAVPDVEGVNKAPITSIAYIKGDMVLMLDFERLVFEISGVDLFEEHAARIGKGVSREDTKVLLAEDSRAMRALIQSNLQKAGYTDIAMANDGQEAWDILEANAAAQGNAGVDLLITDIEMPRIDGLHLTRRIRGHVQLKSLPIVIFSSLVSIDNDKKCQSVGADAQITKPQLDQLVDLIDRLVGEARSRARTPALASV